jgi:hypothetical protein
MRYVKTIRAENVRGLLLKLDPLDDLDELVLILHLGGKTLYVDLPTAGAHHTGRVTVKIASGIEGDNAAVVRLTGKDIMEGNQVSCAHIRRCLESMTFQSDGEGCWWVI